MQYQLDLSREGIQIEFLFSLLKISFMYENFVLEYIVPMAELFIQGGKLFCKRPLAEFAKK
jgi:hypothetical protein